MPPVLTDLSPSEQMRANEANQQEVYGLLACLPDAEVLDSPQMLRICTGVPHPIVNGVVRTQLASTDLDAQITATLDYFRARQVPMMWMVTASSRPDDLSAHLEAHGLILEGAMPGMGIDLQVLPDSLSLPPEVTIEEVTDKPMMDQWSQVLGEGFGLSSEVVAVFARVSDMLGYGEQAPIRNFVAYRKGEPVGTSSLYLGAGVAGIYCVAVVAEARQQGIGAAITATPLQVARDLGYRIGTLQASKMGEPVYRRLGFREHGQFAMYGWADSAE